MHSGWMEKRRGGTERAKHRQYSACIRALRYIGRYLACACPMNAVSFISSTIRRLLRAYIHVLAFFAHHRRPTSLCPSLLSNVRYVRNLAVTNSRTNVNAGVGRLYELFQFTSNCGSFLRFLFFFSPSFSCPFLMFLPLSLSLFLPLVSVYVATSRIAEIPHLFSFSGAVASRAERIARTLEKRRKGKM